jgi:hypothetical protein
MALFQKGQPKSGGRRKGTRDRISTALLEAIAADFEEHGAEAVKIARIERPVEYLRVVASLLPREFEITDNRLTDITDEELDVFIEYAKRQLTLSVIRDVEGREEPTTDGEPIKLLPAL